MKHPIEVTVLIPTKNEEISISQFIEWVFEGFRRSNVKGEIVLLDSSTDRTPDIAEALGARVVKVSEAGLGNAYRKGRNLARGQIIILGDADCTYDFRNLAPFLKKVSEGFDLVVGNRFTGKIEKNAMPALHQYFGSPVTSWIFKKCLGIPTGDIHCGMRAIRVELFDKLPFLESGWEYASEMIVAARNMNARIGEIPIDFYKAPVGRLSHYKRDSWLAPFKSGWGTLRVTATYSFDRILSIPGIVLLFLATAALFFGAFFHSAFLELMELGVFGGAVILAISTMGSFMASLGILTSFIYFGDRTHWRKLANTKLAELALTLFTITTITVIIMLISLFNRWIETTPKSDFSSNNIEMMYKAFWSLSLFFASTGLLIISTLGNHIRKLTQAFD